MTQLKIDEKREAVLKDNGNILIMGGPGSGKTTIALFKAKHIAEGGLLKNGQKVLFLSFARATISRVEEQAGLLIKEEHKKYIEINTYHGFIWSIIKYHGYLLNNMTLRIFSPHEEAARLSGISYSSLDEERDKILKEEGLISFDRFASFCNELLSASQALRRIYSDKYPIVILDEFQDTNLDEWELIKTIGIDSILIALADPNQRIYDFRGADPKRLVQFTESYRPSIYDFGEENNRSDGTDITRFGNDLLIGKNKERHYRNVIIDQYPFLRKPYNHAYLKYKIINEIKELKTQNPEGWSLAVLVPTNSLMVEVSNYMNEVQISKKGYKLPPIKHDVAIDTTGTFLAALFVATLLEGNCNENNVIRALIDHISGRHGNKAPSKKDSNIIAGLEKYIYTGNINGKNRISIIEDCRSLIQKTSKLEYSGDIDQDWKKIVHLVGLCESLYLKHIKIDLSCFPMLQRNTQLFYALDDIWRRNHSYTGAVDAVTNSIVQEHFSMSTKVWSGISIMTIHKAKGKEFDEVIVYEGVYQNKIISKPERIDQARLNLRVAVTRSKQKTIIMTPKNDPCALL